jgi:hypothetical protein
VIVARTFLVCLGLAMVTSQATLAASYDGVLTINVAEVGTGKSLPVRMELRKAGRPIRVRPEGAIVLDGYLVFEGSVTLELKKGNYEFFIEAGPEFQTREGHFEIERHAEDETEVLITRRVNMRGEGWWAGDLDVAQRFDDMPLLMRAAGIDYVPVTTAENFKGKCKEVKQPANVAFSEVSPPLFGPWTVIDNRRGGGLLYVGGDARPDVCKLNADESSLPALNATSEKATQTVALSPFAWDLPIWIASGKLDAVEIIHRNALVDKAVDKEQGGFARDKKFYPGPMGNGRWSEAIYHHLLNCGIRIPPAAGSGSGNNGNPIGTNRVYAYCGEQCSPEGWLAALKAGQVMVTNGPLLRTTVDGYPPGHVFPLSTSEWREFQIALSLTFYEKAAVEYLEIIKNGEVTHKVRLKELAENKGQLPFLKFDESGWFAVRAMTGNTKNYQYATTGPYYVELDGKSRISRRSVQFFLDWLDAAKAEFEDDQTILNDISVARKFWEKLHSQANAE